MEKDQDHPLVRQFDALVYELMHRISSLGTASRDRLLEKAHHIHLEPRKQLEAKDWAWSLLYLVEGSLIREAPGRPKEVLGAGKEAVDQPIFIHTRERHCRVTARRPCEILAFDRRLFELLQEEEQKQVNEIDIFEMGEVESALFQRFTAEHHSGRLEIPGVPEVAERILELSADQDLGLLELSRLVALDPALAARVAKAVGSSLKHGGLSRAVKRLGDEKVREIISDYGIDAGYRQYSPMVQEQMFKVHRHSVHVA